MPKFFRSFGCLAGSLLFLCLPLSAQDMPTRVEAVRLLERANAASLPSSNMPNHKQDVTFRAYGVDGAVKEGNFSAIYAKDGSRDEYNFGDYHGIRLKYQGNMYQNAYQEYPPELSEVDHLIPLLIGRFDKSDIIQSITPATLDGRAAKCIQFETVNGRTYQSNEICLDDELGILLRWKVSDELIEDTDYFSFQGIWLPAHIRHYINGQLRMEIEQKFSVIDGPIDWAVLTPPNATLLTRCSEHRRPIVQSAPQPTSAGPGPWYDIKVQAVIEADGHVREAAVLPAGRPDLEQRAIQIVSGWDFTPATCNGRPYAVNANLTVHFPPQ
ncbi:MAG: energy transducer TonB [Candidatus Acidiferrum sp.]